MQSAASSDTDKKEIASISNLINMVQKEDFTLCSLCNFVVKNETSPNSCSGAENLDCRFFTTYMRVLQDFKDTYLELDDSLPMFERAIDAMNEFIGTSIVAPDDIMIDCITFGLRQQEYKDHVENASLDLLADLRMIRVYLNTCFSFQRRIVETCRGSPVAPMSKSVMNASRSLLGTVEENTCRMKEKLRACKCLVEEFYALQENILNQIFVN